jgi:hypothetical protein
MKDDGGLAFPMCEQVRDGYRNHPGMTLRDWFAGMALGRATIRNESGEPWSYFGMGKVFYDIADSMIQARNEDAQLEKLKKQVKGEL